MAVAEILTAFIPLHALGTIERTGKRVVEATMHYLSDKHEIRLNQSLERLNELYTRAKPEDDGVKSRLANAADRRFDMMKKSGGKTKVCLICMTPRSGSTFFSEALRKTNCLGNPGEWFNAHDGKNIDQTIERYGARSREEILDGIYNFSSSDNGVCTIKGDFFQFLPFIYDGLISRHFDEVKWVFQTRDDILAQAISRYIGSVTGSWSSIQRADAKQEVVYDREEILKQVEFLLDMETGWKRYFAINRIRPSRISYEQLVRSLPSKIQQICKLMKTESPIDTDTIELNLKKQASGKNEQWAQQLADEFL